MSIYGIYMVVIDIVALALILAVVLWLGVGRRRKCRNCRHFAEHYITAFDGQGLFRFGYCQRLIHDCQVVEPDVERECKEFKEVARNGRNV